MRLWYNNVALHDLGDITIASQQSQHDPEQLGHKEIRVITIHIDFWEQTFGANYDLLTQVRAAIGTPGAVLKWQDEDVDSVPGTIYVNQSADVVSHDLPEDKNAWGTYQQQISIAFRVQFDHTDPAIHLQVTFQKTGAGSATNLGNLAGINGDYASSYYSDLLNLRRRASGLMNLSGEFKANPADPLSTRRATLAAKKATLDAQMNGKDGTLIVGASGQFFSGVVRVDSWRCEIDPAAWACKWSMATSYTKFPNEAGYAAAEFSANIAEDKESGDSILSVAGSVTSNSETSALAKFTTVRDAVLAANSFVSSQAIRTEMSKEFLNVDDSQTSSANSGLPGGNVFVKLTFNWQFRKRGDTLSYELVITDADDTRTGLIRRTYSGHVIATGASDDAAYAVALAKANELGNNKHPVRLSSNVSRGSRKLNTAAQEFLRLEFSFEYQLKGERIFAEYSSETAQETFGDTVERVSGFVVAKDAAAASSAYQTLVRSGYAATLIRAESLSSPYMVIQDGVYTDGRWVPAGTNTTQWMRLDFQLSVLRQRADGAWSIKYGILVETDYVQLTKNTRVQGTFFGSASEVAGAAAGTGGNQLDVFLAALALGSILNKSRGADHEKSNSLDLSTHVDFNQNYIDKITSPNTIIQCSVREDIQYSGQRWVFQSIPDGPDVPQDCGTQRGTRVVSGSVVAATEVDAMAWVKKNNPATSGSVFFSMPPNLTTGGGPTPSTRYHQPPKISRDFDFIPLVNGTARDTGHNAKFVKVDFTFEEALLNFSYTEV